MRSQTMPPDRTGESSWLAPQPPPPPVIPQGGYYATQGQGYYYSPKGTGPHNERRVIPPPLLIPAPGPEHGHGHHAQGRGQKVEVGHGLCIPFQNFGADGRFFFNSLRNTISRF
jgi:hypothetical protein